MGPISRTLTGSTEGNLGDDLDACMPPIVKAALLCIALCVIVSYFLKESNHYKFKGSLFIRDKRNPASNIVSLFLRRTGLLSTSNLTITRDGVRGSNGEGCVISKTDLQLLRQLIDNGLFKNWDRPISVENSAVDPLPHFPQEIWVKICSQLEEQDRLNFAQCSAAAYEVAHDPECWREIDVSWSSPLRNKKSFYGLLISRLMVVGRHSKLLDLSDAIVPYFSYAQREKLLPLIPYLCPQLETLVIRHSCARRRHLELLIRELPNLTSLQNLTLDKNVIDDGVMTTLNDILPSLKKLKSLSLRVICVSDSGVRALIQVLPRLPALQSLDLSFNAFDPALLTAVPPHIQLIWKRALRYESIIRLDHNTTLMSESI